MRLRTGDTDITLLNVRDIRDNPRLKNPDAS